MPCLIEIWSRYNTSETCTRWIRRYVSCDESQFNQIFTVLFLYFHCIASKENWLTPFFSLALRAGLLNQIRFINNVSKIYYRPFVGRHCFFCFFLCFLYSLIFVSIVFAGCNIWFAPIANLTNIINSVYINSVYINSVINQYAYFTQTFLLIVNYNLSVKLTRCCLYWRTFSPLFIAYFVFALLFVILLLFCINNSRILTLYFGNAYFIVFGSKFQNFRFVEPYVYLLPLTVSRVARDRNRIYTFSYKNVLIHIQGCSGQSYLFSFLSRVSLRN